MASVRTLKIVVAGSPCVGKTAFIRRHRWDDFATKYVPSEFCVEDEIAFATTSGPITLKVFDLPDAAQRDHSDDAHYKTAEGLVVMYDVSAPESFERARELVDLHAQLPTVVC